MAARKRRDGQAPEMRFRQARVDRAQRAILMMAASSLPSAPFSQTQRLVHQTSL